MQNKKNPKADIGRNSSIYFALGLALMMFMSYATINYKVYDKDKLGLERVNMDALDEEEVPITEQVKPPPPPPPPPPSVKYDMVHRGNECPHSKRVSRWTQ